MAIIWLASYPKSGSTWLRAVLTSYLRPDAGPVSINDLVATNLIDRSCFDEVLGLPSSDLTPGEALKLRPLLHELMAAELPAPAFVKVHDACVRTPAGPLFPRAATAAAIYLVRNPLDVAVSYAHHLNAPIGVAVREMNRDEPARAGATGLNGWLFEEWLSWSANVSSWLRAELPVHVARYEDMLADPAGSFGAIVRFAGLEWSPSRLERAVDAARFDRLRAQEERDGFRERQPTAPSFFRAGRSGDWRTALSRDHVRALVDRHGPVMGRFGYLEEAESFLAGAASGA